MRDAHGRRHGVLYPSDDHSTVALPGADRWFQVVARRTVSWLVVPLWGALLIFTCVSAHADIKYVYDSTGRVVQVIAADGSSAHYQYDGAGNITAINRLSAGQLVVTAFSPSTGAPGSTVIISGSGFSATPSQNTVAFNGVAAVVAAANANQLTVTVPASATTGPISVTTAAGTVSSADTFTVAQALVITGFSPSHGPVGATVTVNGTAFNPVPGQTGAALAPQFVIPSSISDSQVQFVVPTGVSVGPIRVSTPNATATTSDLFWVIPETISPANVVSFASLQGATAQSVNLNQANKFAALSFDGSQNELVTLHLTPFDSSGGVVSVNVFNPQNILFHSGSLDSASRSLHLPRLPMGGRYTVYFGSGSSTHQFSVSLDRNLLIPLDGASRNISTAFGTTKRVQFYATAGQTVGIGITGISMSPNGYINFRVTQADGQQFGGLLACDGNVSAPGCTFALRNLPTTGTYLVTAWPSIPSAMSFSVTASPAITATLTPNTPISLALDVPGKVASYTFTAAAGQSLGFNIGSPATVPANEPVRVLVYDAAGTVVGDNNATAATVNLANLAAGTYTAVVYVRDAATATMQVTLGWANGELPLDGTTVNFVAPVFDQNGEFTFNATVGQTVGIGITGISMSPNGYINFRVTQPNNQQFGGLLACDGRVSAPGCTFALRNLPATGTYRLSAWPSIPSAMSFSVTASPAITATLTPNTPISLALDVPGKVASYTFTAAAGQSLGFSIGSPVTVPANELVRVYVFNPSGTQVGTSHSATAATINLPNLTAGAYSVLVYVTDAATATLQATLQ